VSKRAQYRSQVALEESARAHRRKAAMRFRRRRRARRRGAGPRNAPRETAALPGTEERKVRAPLAPPMAKTPLIGAWWARGARRPAVRAAAQTAAELQLAALRLFLIPDQSDRLSGLQLVEGGRAPRPCSSGDDDGGRALPGEWCRTGRALGHPPGQCCRRGDTGSVRIWRREGLIGPSPVRSSNAGAAQRRGDAEADHGTRTYGRR
jgi:hypothetical protein